MKLISFIITRKLNQIIKHFNGNFYLIPRRLVKRTGVYKFIKQIIRKINLIHRF